MLGNPGSTRQVGDPRRRSARPQPLRVAYFPPKFLEVLGVVDGSPLSKNTSRYLADLAVSFHRVPVDAVFDPCPFLAFPQVTADLFFKVPTVQRHPVPQKRITSGLPKLVRI